MRKTQIILATGEVYDVEDKVERRILIPVEYIKQEEEKHEQSDFDGTFNTGSTGEIHTGAGIVLTGRIQTGSYTNKDNIKVYTTEVIAEDIEFAESKAAAEGSGGAGGHQKPDQTEKDGFMNIPEGIDEELPFN